MSRGTDRLHSVRVTDQHAPDASIGAWTQSAERTDALSTADAEKAPEFVASRQALTQPVAPAHSNGQTVAAWAGVAPERSVSARSDESWSALRPVGLAGATHAAAAAGDAIEDVEVDITPLSAISDLPFASASEAAAADAPSGSRSAALLDASRLRASAAIDTLLEVGPAAHRASSRAESAASGAMAQNKYLQRLQWPPVQAAVRERSWLHERLDESLAISASSSGAYASSGVEALPLRDANAPTMTDQHESAWAGFTTLRSERGGRKLGGLAFGEDSAEDMLQENVAPAAVQLTTAAPWTSIASDGAQSACMSHDAAVVAPAYRYPETGRPPVQAHCWRTTCPPLRHSVRRRLRGAREAFARRCANRARGGLGHGWRCYVG